MGASLIVERVAKKFGGLAAVQDVSFFIKEGEIVGLIGPNGAGKTTLFNCISGYYKVTSGHVYLGEKEITNLSSDQIAHLGLARTFQIVRPLNNISVIDNITVGALINTSDVNKARHYAKEICEFGGLAHKKDYLAQKLTIAEKKRLEILRALATRPSILLLDETMAGLTPNERKEAVELVKKINKEMDITILIIEHVLDIVMPLSNRIVVLDSGVKIAEGLPHDVVREEKVIKAYLGARYHAQIAAS